MGIEGGAGIGSRKEGTHAVGRTGGALRPRPGAFAVTWSFQMFSSYDFFHDTQILVLNSETNRHAEKFTYATCVLKRFPRTSD